MTKKSIEASEKTKKMLDSAEAHIHAALAKGKTHGGLQCQMFLKHALRSIRHVKSAAAYNLLARRYNALVPFDINPGQKLPLREAEDGKERGKGWFTSTRQPGKRTQTGPVLPPPPAPPQQPHPPLATPAPANPKNA